MDERKVGEMAQQAKHLQETRGQGPEFGLQNPYKMPGGVTDAQNPELRRLG